MFDIGWSEIAIIALIALIVIGPKDLPKVLKTIGYWVGKARSLTREFQKGVEDVIKEAELDEVRDQINSSVKDFDIKDQIEKSIDPDAELTEAFDVTMDENMSETAVEEKQEKKQASGAKKAAKTKEPSAKPLADAEKMPTISSPEDDGDKDKA